MHLERSIMIGRPIEAVFAFVTDMHNVCRWMPVQEIHQIDQTPMGVGATFSQRAEFLGQHFEGVLKVTEYEPPRLFSLTLVQGPFPLTNRMIFTAAGPAMTQLTLQGEAEPGRVLKFAGPLLSSIAGKQLDSQLQKLKRLLEQ